VRLGEWVRFLRPALRTQQFDPCSVRVSNERRPPIERGAGWDDDTTVEGLHPDPAPSSEQTPDPTIHVVYPEAEVVQLGPATVRFPRAAASAELVEFNREPVLGMFELDTDPDLGLPAEALTESERPVESEGPS